jgi:hypothetical protein
MYRRRIKFHILDLGNGISEYLDHNELGLAWEGMQEIADAHGIVTAEFWRPMAKAAGLMLVVEQEGHYL